MEDKKILFLDTGSDSELKLNFSLHMAGFRIMNFRTLDEAVNWGATCSRPEDTLCVLINAHNSPESLKKDLRLYRDHAPHLPVVWIEQSPGQKASDLSDMENVIVCAPDNLPDTLKKLQKSPEERSPDRPNPRGEQHTP